MKFRKKPIVIEAEQFSIVSSKPLDGICMDTHMYKIGPHIHTPEGAMEVSDGDWIIKGIQGEYYPCKPDIFDMTYDKVE